MPLFLLLIYGALSFAAARCGHCDNRITHLNGGGWTPHGRAFSRQSYGLLLFFYVIALGGLYFATLYLPAIEPGRGIVLFVCLGLLVQFSLALVDHARQAAARFSKFTAPPDAYQSDDFKSWFVQVESPSQLHELRRDPQAASQLVNTPLEETYLLPAELAKSSQSRIPGLLISPAHRGVRVALLHRIQDLSSQLQQMTRNNMDHLTRLEAMQKDSLLLKEKQGLLEGSVSELNKQLVTLRSRSRTAAGSHTSLTKEELQGERERLLSEIRSIEALLQSR